MKRVVAPRPPRSRHSRRRRRAWTLAAVGLLLVVGAAVVLNSPWMSVREIEIVGASRADVAGRLADAGIGEGAIMIWLRPGEVEQAVLADPWVREVRAERIFPSRLVVEVLEHTPALWVRGESRWMLLARAGVVIETADAPGEGLLCAEVWYPDHRPGEQPEGTAWEELVDLALSLSPEVAEGAWVTSEGGELWIEAGGHRARLGRAVSLADKGRALEVLLDGGLAEGAVIDLVASARPAVTVPGTAGGSSAAPEGGDEGEAVVEGEDGD